MMSTPMRPVPALAANEKLVAVVRLEPVKDAFAPKGINPSVPLIWGKAKASVGISAMTDAKVRMMRFRFIGFFRMTVIELTR